MRISRRYSSEAADFIEKIEQHLDAPPNSLSIYLVALLINKGDDLPPRCHAHELVSAANWMPQFGMLRWHREGNETVVSWREHLN
jgi:hypothetical protein